MYSAVVIVPAGLPSDQTMPPHGRRRLPPVRAHGPAPLPQGAAPANPGAVTAQDLPDPALGIHRPDVSPGIGGPAPLVSRPVVGGRAAMGDTPDGVGRRGGAHGLDGDQVGDRAASAHSQDQKPTRKRYAHE